jgi:hypothetical protein
MADVMPVYAGEGGNPALTVMAFLRAAQKEPRGDPAGVVLRKMLAAGSMAELYRRLGLMLELMGGCQLFGAAVQKQNPLVPSDGLESMGRIFTALREIGLDKTWEHFLVAIGDRPTLAFQWLVPYYGLSPEPGSLKAWVAKVNAGLQSVIQTLELVQDGDRPTAWYVVRLHLQQAVDHLETLPLEGGSAALRVNAEIAAAISTLPRRARWARSAREKLLVVKEDADLAASILSLGALAVGPGAAQVLAAGVLGGLALKMIKPRNPEAPKQLPAPRNELPGTPKQLLPGSEPDEKELLQQGKSPLIEPEE